MKLLLIISLFLMGPLNQEYIHPYQQLDPKIWDSLFEEMSRQEKEEAIPESPMMAPPKEIMSPTPAPLPEEDISE